MIDIEQTALLCRYVNSNGPQDRVVTWCVILYRMHCRKNKHLIMKAHYVFVINFVILIVG